MRIIGEIKRQFFHMVTHVFDNSNLSQEIFAIYTWGAVICSLGRGRKHMLTIIPTIWRPGLKSIPWTLAEFRHNRIEQSPHEIYLNVCRQHKEK